VSEHMGSLIEHLFQTLSGKSRWLQYTCCSFKPFERPRSLW